MPLPVPGSQAYLPNLLNYLQSSPTLGGYKPDPTLFSIILLATIVRKGGIIIDVHHDTTSGSKRKGKAKAEYRQEEVNKVVGNVLAICRGIFGWRTNVVQLHEGMDPGELPGLISSDTRRRAKRKSKVDGQLGANRSRPSYPYTMSDDGSREHERDIPDILLVTGLETAESPIWIRLVEILTTRRLRNDLDERSGILGEGFLVIWVREEGKGLIPGWLLDQFALSTQVLAMKLDIAPDLDLDDIIPDSYIQTLRNLIAHTHIHPPLLTRISNLLSAVSLHPLLKATITAKALLSFPQFVRAHRLLSSPFTLPTNIITQPSTASPPTWAEMAGEEPTLHEDEEGWYARNENVEGVFMSCLRHRVRSRGERGEVMWLLESPAVSPKLDSGGNSRLGRSAVDKVLEDIILSV